MIRPLAYTVAALLFATAAAAAIGTADFYPKINHYVFTCGFDDATPEVFGWEFDGQRGPGGADRSTVFHTFTSVGMHHIVCLAVDDGEQLRQEMTVEVDAVTRLPPVEDEQAREAFPDVVRTSGGDDAGDETNTTQEENNASTELRADLRVDPWYPQGASYVYSCGANFEPLAYSWYFGDGEKLLLSDRQDVYHTYAVNGDYTVSCVAHRNGTSVRAATNVSVTAAADPAAPRDPQLWLRVLSTDGLRASLLCDSERELQSVEWRFGDNTSATGDEQVSHEYPAAGEYTASCSADGVNASSRVSVAEDNQSAAGTVWFSETFPDEYPSGWERSESGTMLESVWAADGELRLAYNNRGTPGGISLDSPGTLRYTHPVDIPVSALTTFSGRAMYTEEDLPAECGDGCEYYPAQLRLLLEQENGDPAELWIAYASEPHLYSARGLAVDARELAPNEWTSAEVRIRSYVPDAARVTGVQLALGGWSGRAYFDDLYVYEAQPSDPLDPQQPDVAPVSLTLQEQVIANDVVGQGDPAANFTVRNRGEGPAEAFEYRVVASRDALLDENDTVVGEERISAPLSSGASLDGTLRLHFGQDMGAGFYEVFLVTDTRGELNESDEDNALLVDRVFLVSPTLDESYSPAPVEDAAVALGLINRSPVDQMAAIECVPDGFMPTRYHYRFDTDPSSGVSYSEPVERLTRDVLHYFPGAGNFSVECVATDQTNNASDTFTVETTMPLPWEQFTGAEPLPENESLNRWLPDWAIYLTWEETDEYSGTFTCDGIGFAEAEPRFWKPEEGHSTLHRGREWDVTFPGPGNYTVACSTGFLPEWWQWPYSYRPNPRAYGQNAGCCTGDQTSLTVRID